MPTTMKDIAEKLNISVGAVSSALNDRCNISEKTKKLVLKTAEELNYTPNYIARSLVHKKTSTIGVMIPDISELFYSEILNGIENIAAENKYDILFRNTRNDPILEVSSIRIFLGKRVDGLLIYRDEQDNKFIELLKTINIPYVLLTLGADLLECDYVNIDPTYGTYITVNYLIKKGYEEFVFIYSSNEKHLSAKRIEGFEKAFKENNIAMERLQLLHCVRNLDEFYKIANRSIHYSGKKTGVVIWDDEMALSVYKAIYDKGISIPEQIGIIGCDDIKASKYYMKPLTTVSYPVYDMAIKGTELLIKKIKSKKPLKPSKITLKPHFVERETA